MPKTVIEQLKDIQTQLSHLSKDRKLHAVSIGPHLKEDPPHPNGRCGLTAEIQTSKEFAEALRKIHQWVGYMIKVVKPKP
jgi:hypothetical protein